MPTVSRPFQEIEQVVNWKQPYLAFGQTGTEYFKRGWTFQEYQLSNRRLVFAQDRMFWRCGCAMREHYDETKHGQMLKIRKGPGMNFDIHPPESLGEYVYVYKHPAIPNRYFWLQLPVNPEDKAAEPPHGIKTQTPYISCDTSRGWFAATKFDLTDWPPGMTPDYLYRQSHFRLLDDSGIRCGALDCRTDDREQDGAARVRFPYPDADDAPKVELVAICRSRQRLLDTATKASSPAYLEAELMHERRDELEEGLSEEAASLETPDFYEVYRVLWVRWQDGVACRKSADWVYRDAWESHHTEKVQLIMG